MIQFGYFLSRSASTVSGNLGKIRKGFRMLDDLGLDPNYPALGPWPIGDFVGFTLVLQLLQALQLKGKHHDSYQQYDTISKIKDLFW